MARHRYDTEATKHDLLTAARKLFSDVGYAEARTEEIVASAGLTRGALYHHFGNKQGLFVAVLEVIHLEVAEEINRAGLASTGGPIEALRAGFHAYLDATLNENVRRILLVDGPAVIGWQEWNELDREHGFGVTRSVLEHAMRNGEFAEAPLDELTRVLMGAVTQAALELGQEDVSPATRNRYGQVIDVLLDSLRTT